MADPLFKARLRQLQDDRDSMLFRAIGGLWQKVAGRLSELLDSESESTQLGALREVRQWTQLIHDHREREAAQETLDQVAATITSDSSAEEIEEALVEILGPRES